MFLYYVGLLGPFVMTTEEEIQQAISDYQSARNGFERAGNWRSKITDSFWNATLNIYLFVCYYSVLCLSSQFLDLN